MAVLGSLTLDIKDKIRLTITQSSSEDRVLRAVLGTNVPNCSEFTLERKNKCIVIVFSDFATLSVQKIKHEKGTRYDLEWELAKPVKKMWLSDMIDMSGANWYGAAQVRSQQWPIEKWSRPISAFVCGDSFVDQYGGVQERYWLSSNGIAVFVDEDSPLFVGMNDGGDSKLNLVSKFEKPYKNIHNRNLYLKYSIYQSSDVKSVHQMVAQHRLAPPTCIPDEQMFRYPIWSTWAKYKTNINQKIIIDYAKEINDHGFKSCQVEIDDDWTPAYGDMTFDPKRFPDPKAMVTTLGEMGHRVTLWVHPFASPWSKACYNGIKQCWVSSGIMPGITKWWNGLARHLDVTNPAATEWFKESLNKLQTDYGVTSFKFDAGEVNLLPPVFKLYKEVQNPNVFTKRYAELACEVDSEVRCHEVRVGWRTQHLPVFVRMMDKDSNWTWDNGLKTLIPHALTFSLLGYPFILPDMIGGNAYKTEFPERELFIRWLQVTALMPALQFSIPPWQYDPEVVDISKKMCDLHAQFSDYIIATAKECVTTGDPILRPLWWINPNDDITLTMDSQFLIGNKVLVAPVLEPGARQRDIYIPLGRWRDQNTQEILEGPLWIRDYIAELDQLPHFVLGHGNVRNLTGNAKVQPGNGAHQEVGKSKIAGLNQAETVKIDHSENIKEPIIGESVEGNHPIEKSKIAGQMKAVKVGTEQSANVKDAGIQDGNAIGIITTKATPQNGESKIAQTEPNEKPEKSQIKEAATEQSEEPEKSSLLEAHVRNLTGDANVQTGSGAQQEIGKSKIAGINQVETVKIDQSENIKEPRLEECVEGNHPIEQAKIPGQTEAVKVGTEQSANVKDAGIKEGNAIGSITTKATPQNGDSKIAQTEQNETPEKSQIEEAATEQSEKPKNSSPLEGAEAAVDHTIGSEQDKTASIEKGQPVETQSTETHEST